MKKSIIHLLTQYFSSRFTVRLVFMLIFFNALQVEAQTVASSTPLNNFSAPSPIISTEVPWFQSDMVSNPTWATLFRNDGVFAKIVLSLDYTQAFDVSYNALIEVDLNVNVTDINNNNSLVTTTLSLNYNNTVVTSTNDMTTKFFNDIYKINAQVMQIRVNSVPLGIGVGVGPQIKLQVFESASRVWEMTPTKIVDLNSILIQDNTTTESNVVVNWDPISEAAEYELEWTFIDYFSLKVAPHTNTSTIPTPTYDQNTPMAYSFKNNASRIRTSNTTFTLPALYERGYLVFRVRPIGYDILSSSKDIEILGEWTVAEEGNVQYYNSGTPQDKYIIFVEDIDKTRTWQSSLTFAEDGKIKQVISYYDESLRPRQTQTRLNTPFMDNGTAIQPPIVGQNIYDNIGRAAISALPVPTKDDLTLKYKTNFVQYDNSGTLENYSWQHFDKDGIPGLAMSTASGPSKYYSAYNNFDRLNHTYNNTIPDAGGYTFAQTEFTPDNTGRIRRQGGVGNTHQLNSGHESFYYYATPFQEELYRLFGNDVGNAVHHEKNAVVDPNGQVSVSYLDAEGRVIATSLAGDPPTGKFTDVSNNLESWPGGVNPNLLNVKIPEIRRISDGEIHSIISEKTFFVSYTKDYTINYDIQVSTYNNSCLPSNLCFDCVYDLTISVVDQNGVQWIPSGTGSNGAYTASVGSISQMASPCSTGVLSFNIGTSGILLSQLPKGTYTIMKKLTVNKSAMEHYLQEFKNNNTCILTLQDFIDEEHEEIDNTKCDDGSCETCNTEKNAMIAAYNGGDTTITQADIDAKTAICAQYCNLQTPCEILYTQMLSDVRPGGQYAPYLYIDGNGDEQNAHDGLWVQLSYSLLNPLKTNGIHYRNPKDETGAATEYKNEDGSKAVILQVNGVPSTVWGATYYDKNGNAWTSGDKYIRPQDIGNPNVFISLFRREWAKQLVYYHPEYCRYTACMAIKESYDYDNKLLLTETGALALSEGMFDNLSNCSTPTYYNTIPGTTKNDPLFFTPLNSISGASATSMCTSMQSYFDFNSDSNLENLWETAEHYASSTWGNNCTSDEVWIMYRSHYLGLKRSYLEAYYDAQTCDINGLIASRYGSTLNITNFDKRFLYKREDLNDPRTKATELGIDVTNYSGLNAQVGVAKKTECENDCEAFATIWLANMEGCEYLTSTQKQIIITELINVCKNSCLDNNAENGAKRIALTPTSNGNKSFTDVFKWFENTHNIPLTNACNPLLLDYPGPSNFEMYERKIDACFCDKVNLVKANFDSEAYSAPICSYEDAFMHEYGVAIDDAKDAFCHCKFLSNPNLVPLETDSCYAFYMKNIAYSDSCEEGINFDGQVLEDFINHLINNPVEEGPAILMATYFPSFFDVTTYPYTASNDTCLLKFTSDILSLPDGSSEQWTIHIFDNCGFSCNIIFTYTESPPNPSIGIGNITSINFVNNGSGGVNLQIAGVPSDGAWLSMTQNCFDITCEKVLKLPITLIENDMTCSKCLECCEYKDLKLKFYRYMGYALEVYTPDYINEFYQLFSLYLKEKYNFNYTSANLIDFEKECTGQGYCISLDTTFYHLRFQAMKLGETWIFSPYCPPSPEQNPCIDSNLVVSNCPCESIIYTPEGATTPSLCEKLEISEEDPCTETLEYRANVQAYERYARYIKSIEDDFRKSYIAHCMNPVEQFTMAYSDKEYHFTLYYYDQAGNLVKTVPPAGIDFVHFTQTQLNSRIANAQAHAASPLTQPFEEPNHKLITYYTYNTLSQISTQQTPDGGKSAFWYDNLGRMVASQNAKQLPNNQYSYTLYDDLSRIKQVGQTTNSTAMDYSISTNDIETYWLNNNREQLTVTIYDEAHSSTIQLKNHFAESTQINLRNRVSAMLYVQTYDFNDPNFANYKKASHYSYDIHGNVNEMVQENTSFSLTNEVMRYKKLDYKYDLISGNVNQVTFQKGEIDQLMHRYAYDAENRLLRVETATDSREWTMQAKYIYYLHGPLARVELGDLNVQGMDYAYTLHGWLKGINSGSLDPTKDIGRDGDLTLVTPTNPNVHFARDAAGVNLSYYSGDYAPINLSYATFEASKVGSNMSGHSYSLYNGNISSMVTALPDKNNYATNQTIVASAKGYAYLYDHLNRIGRMTSYDITGNQWQNLQGPSVDASPLYASYNYDANGNITKLVRNNASLTLNRIDSFEYHYEKDVNNRLVSNKLYHVTEKAPATPSYDGDIEAMGTFTSLGIQTNNNYVYDNIGNLVKDKSERIDEIVWNVYGKIQEIRRETTLPAHQKSDLVFEYDASGNRIVKIEKPRDISGNILPSNQWVYDYYVRDASGNIMANYSAVGNQVIWTTSPLYGSSRLGVLNKNTEIIDASGMLVGFSLPDDYEYQRGEIQFELSNHLGNVLAVVSDRKMAARSAGPGNWQHFNVAYSSFSDYYPFGMLMDGRSFTSVAYRYSFNGKEKISELNVNGNSLDYGARICDSRLGRFLSCDPLESEYPWQSTYIYGADNPIHYMEKEGESPDPGDLAEIDQLNNSEPNPMKLKWRIYKALFPRSFELKCADLGGRGSMYKDDKPKIRPVTIKTITKYRVKTNRIRLNKKNDKSVDITISTPHQGSIHIGRFEEFEISDKLLIEDGKTGDDLFEDGGGPDGSNVKIENEDVVVTGTRTRIRVFTNVNKQKRGSAYDLKISYKYIEKKTITKKYIGRNPFRTDRKTGGWKPTKNEWKPKKVTIDSF